VQEMKMSLNDKQMSIYELTRVANERKEPDFSKFVTTVTDQVSEVVQS